MCHICYAQRKMGQCISHEFFYQEANSTTDTLSKSVCVLTGHEHNELKYYCCEESCSKTVCDNCIVESHKDHETKPVSEELTKRKKAMENVLQATKEKIKNVKRFLDTINNNKVLFVQNDEKGRKSLNEQKVRAFKYITDFQEETVKCADARLQKYVKVLERRQAQIKFFIENSRECCIITEEALSGKNMNVFLSVEKTLMEKLKTFEQSDVDKPLDTMPPASDFEVQDPILELKGRINQMTNGYDGTKREYGGTTGKLKFIKGNITVKPLTKKKTIARWYDDAITVVH